VAAPQGLIGAAAAVFAGGAEAVHQTAYRRLQSSSEAASQLPAAAVQAPMSWHRIELWQSSLDLAMQRRPGR